MALPRRQPQENVLVESFIGRLRNECLNETLLSSHSEARGVLAERRDDYDRVRQHSVFANRTPEAFRTQQLAVAATKREGQGFSPGLDS